MSNAQTEDGGRLYASVLETARRLVTFGFLVPAANAGEGRSDASTNERKPAPDAAAPRGVGRGRPRRVVAGRRASARDEAAGPARTRGGRRASCASTGAARPLGLAGRTPGRRGSCGAATCWRRPTAPWWASSSRPRSPRRCLSESRRDRHRRWKCRPSGSATSTLFGIGAGGARGVERAYAVLGGTGRFAGARGTFSSASSKAEPRPGAGRSSSS